MEILINIDVDDLDKAIAFYANAFNLSFRGRLFNGEVAEMGGTSTVVYLLRKSSGTLASPGTSALRDYHRHWTPVHIELVIDDLDLQLNRRSEQKHNWNVRPKRSFGDVWGHSLIHSVMDSVSYSGWAAVMMTCSNRLEVKQLARNG